MTHPTVAFSAPSLVPSPACLMKLIERVGTRCRAGRDLDALCKPVAFPTADHACGIVEEFHHRLRRAIAPFIARILQIPDHVVTGLLACQAAVSLADLSDSIWALNAAMKSGEGSEGACCCASSCCAGASAAGAAGASASSSL